MFHIEQSTQHWHGTIINRHSILDKNGVLYVIVSTTSNNPTPQIEICGGSGQRSPEAVIEYAQALMEGVKIYAYLLNDFNKTVEGYQEDEPRAYDDTLPRTLPPDSNIIVDDEKN